jgi:hypothetical protein
LDSGPDHSAPAVAEDSFQGQASHHGTGDRRIVARELNPERKRFYELAWHLGASQSDVANLYAEDINWQGEPLPLSE